MGRPGLPSDDPSGDFGQCKLDFVNFPRCQGCRKRHKALNHEEHKGKEKLFFVHFVVPFFSEPFATPSFARTAAEGEGTLSFAAISKVEIQLSSQAPDLPGVTMVYSQL